MSIENPESRKPTEEELRKKLNLDKMTNTEAVVFLIKHIDNPCETEVAPGEFENIRRFYLQIAEDLMEKLDNPHAKKLLKNKMEEYKDEL